MHKSCSILYACVMRKDSIVRFHRAVIFCALVFTQLVQINIVRSAELSLPQLTTASAIAQLKREDAQRGYPVKIRGVVTTEDGESYDGDVVWDNDEAYTWEHLNGEFKGVEMAIPFSIITSIEKNSQRSAAVTLKNGSTYLLSGSNDVNEDNKGVFVERTKGKLEEIDWYDFAKLAMK